MAALLERFRVPLSWSQLLKQTFNETLADDVFNLAAQQAYYFFFALFPALLALLSIASFFPVENLSGEITTMLQRVPPDRYGAVSAAWNAAYDLGWGVGALGVGLVVASLGVPAGFVTGAVLARAALPLTRPARQPRRR